MIQHDGLTVQQLVNYIRINVAESTVGGMMLDELAARAQAADELRERYPEEFYSYTKVRPNDL